MSDELTFTKTTSSTDDQEQDLVWINLYEVRKEKGEFTFTFNSARYNGSAGSDGEGRTITLIDTTMSKAVTVWINPNPNALYPQDPDKTDGMRLFRAIGRKYAEEGEEISISDLIDRASENGGTLIVRLNKMKSGHEAWLWNIN